MNDTETSDGISRGSEIPEIRKSPFLFNDDQFASSYNADDINTSILGNSQRSNAVIDGTDADADVSNPCTPAGTPEKSNLRAHTLKICQLDQTYVLKCLTKKLNIFMFIVMVIPMA